MLLAQITDSHLRPDGRYPRHDPGKALVDAVSMLNRMRPRPDAVLFTGDLMDRVAAQDYGPVCEVLQSLDIPLLPIPGNNDERAPFIAAFGKALPLAGDGFCHYLWPLGDIHLVALDTKGPEGGGQLCAARLRWLEGALEAAPGPVVVFMHHPPFTTGMTRIDEQGFEGADTLAALLRGHGNVLQIVAGHVHRPITTLWHGMLATTCPALGQASALSLADDAPHAHSDEPPALQLHRLHGCDVASHTVSLAMRDQPRSPEGAPLADPRLVGGS